MTMTEDVAADVVLRDVVSAGELARLAALPLPRRLLVAAVQIAEADCLPFGLRALGGVYVRAAVARQAGSEERKALEASALECRALGLAADVVWSVSEAATAMARLDEAERLAADLEDLVGTQAAANARRYRAIAEHLAAVAGVEG